MSEQKRHIKDLPETVFRLLIQLLVEEGFLTEGGYLTPLGEQYVAAMSEDATAPEVTEVAE